jgi:hypothetical protein
VYLFVPPNHGPINNQAYNEKLGNEGTLFKLLIKTFDFHSDLPKKSAVISVCKYNLS